MKRILSSTLFVLALLALGALAFLAMNGAPGLPVVAGQSPDASDVPAPAAEAVLAPEAPAATSKINAIALPLDVQSVWSSAGYGFNAHGLAQAIGIASVSQVLHLNPSLQTYDKWFPGSNYGFYNGAFTTIPWPLQTGGAYRVILNSSDPALSTLSLVGDVPAPDSISFTLVGGSPSCKLNDIMIPLDQSTITNATELATSMGGSSNVAQVLQLNANLQAYDKWFPGSGFGFVNGAFTTTPFTVRIGYPYAVCLTSAANNMEWP